MQATPATPASAPPTLRVIHPSSSDGADEPADSQEFLKVLEGAITGTADQAFAYLQSQELSKEDAGGYICQTFLSKKRFQGLGSDLRLLGEKVVHFLAQKAQLWQLSPTIQKVEKLQRICLPKPCVDSLAEIAARLQDLSPSDWEQFVAANNGKSQGYGRNLLQEEANFSSFVYRFNRDFGQREEFRRKAFAILDGLREQAWKKSLDVRVIPDLAKISWARKALLLFYQCQDSSIKERALKDLIDLLESDPIHMITAYDLVDLQELLMREIQAHKAQNLNVVLQRLLIKAYATTLECILLHANSGHLNALEERIKHNLWDSASSLEGFNINKDEEISLWTKFAVQGAQRIKTDVAEWKKWLPRILAIGNAIIQIGMLIQEPQKIFSVVAEVVSDLSDAFHHFERHKDWFEELMILRRLTRVSLLDVQSFRKVTNLFQLSKKNNTNQHVLYGSISTLEHAVINSPSRVIREEAIKVMIQYATLSSKTIQERIVLAYVAMLSGDSVSLRNTAFVILRLLEETGYIKNEDIWQEVRKSPVFVDLLKDQSPEFQASLARDIYHSVVKFVIRRIGDIKGEKDHGGHSFTTLICSSTNDSVIIPLLRCLNSLSQYFSECDVKGNTPFHIGIWERNLQLLRHAHEVFASKIDDCEYADGDTALHLAARRYFTDGAKMLLRIGADPNLLNQEGNTPLHLAVQAESRLLAVMLLDNDVKKNTVNIFGETPLNIAIKKNDPHLVELLLGRGGKIAEHINQITPISFAARHGSEQTLIYLLEHHPDNLSLLEALEITRMISRDGEEISASAMFCNYHLDKLASSPGYAAAFQPFQSLPHVEKRRGQGIFLANPRKYSMGQLPAFPGERMGNPLRRKGKVLRPVDDFGNTELILLAKSQAKIHAFGELLQGTKNINASNFMGLTALHAAVIYGNEKAVATLLQVKGIDIHAKDISGFNALHFAAYTRNPAMIEMLIEARCDPHAQNDYGDTPLLIFCGNYPKRSPESLWSIVKKPELIIHNGNSLEILERLLEYGAAYDQLDYQGNNALHHAIGNGTDLAIYYLFDKFPELMWGRNIKGLLPMQEAILKRRRVDVSKLLKGKSLIELHQEFTLHTKNRFTLGNLMALAGETKGLEALFRADSSLAAHKDDSPYKETPIHIAAKHGITEVIEVYKTLGLTLSMEDGFGNTPAHIAAMEEQIPFLEALKDCGVNMAHKNRDGRTPLHLAATRDKVNSVTLLAAVPELSREKDGNGDLALHLACKFKRAKSAEILCESYPEGIHEVDDDFNTPLHHACFSGNALIVTMLAAHGARIEPQNISGQTPLSIACLYGHKEVVDYLLLIGADISSQDLERETPLHKAVFGQHLPIVDALLKADSELIRPKERALVHIADVDDETPLHELPKVADTSLAKMGYREAIMASLIRYGAEVARRKVSGETFLHLVAFYGHDDLLKGCLHLLSDLGRSKEFDVNEKDNQGNSLLHSAVGGNRLSTARQLIGLGASLKQRNEAGETPFFTAVKLGHFSMAALLSESGAAVKTRDAERRTVMHALLDREELSPQAVNFMKWLIKRAPCLLYHRDEKRRSPLHVIAERNHCDVLELVLEHLGGPQDKRERFLWKRTSSGMTAREVAKNNHFDVLERALRIYRREDLGTRNPESLVVEPLL